jgi:hypothetical protein
MKVFLSWSGERSRVVAEALRHWLPDIIQDVEPWMSKADIAAGARWGGDLETELAASKFGILCLTPENQLSPWIIFEAGALAKTIPDTFVCPYLIHMEPAEMKAGPLTLFQWKRSIEAETFDLVASINQAKKEKPIADDRLRRLFDRFWPDLKKVLDDLPPRDSPLPVLRRTEDMVTEILEIVRMIARRDNSTRYGQRLSDRYEIEHFKPRRMMVEQDQLDSSDATSAAIRGLVTKIWEQVANYENRLSAESGNDTVETEEADG